MSFIQELQLLPQSLKMLVLFLFIVSIISIVITLFIKSSNERLEQRALSMVSPSKGNTKTSRDDNNNSIVIKPASSGGLFSDFKKILVESRIGWSLPVYFIVTLVSILCVFIFLKVIFSTKTPMAIVITLLIGPFIPYWYVKRTLKLHRLRFETELPNAIDIIVRGIRSGLPLVDCVRIIATEAQEPVKSEFRRVLEDQAVGIPLSEAMQKLPTRITSPEANFLSIVITIQSQSGGSLSEALANLSTVIRERHKMKRKIKAMSSEATASAGIIASMPFMVAGMVYLTSPDYIKLLFTDFTGNMVLAVSGLWMATGTFIMKKMINFDF